MIRRITKNNDLKDLIKSCPTGVIDDIYSIRYYIAGNPDVEIEPTFSKVNNHLEVVIPSSMLENLGNGILMRRSLYKAADPEYPDGYYNLEFIDNMDIWLGEEEVSPFVPSGDYLTASDLKTINYQSIVGNGNINIEASVPDYYATKSWVSSQGYATESWVSGQGYLTSVILDGYATESWVLDQGYITSTGVSGLATMSWVEAQGYITSETLPEDIATQSWVSSNFLSTTALTGYATESFVMSQGLYLYSQVMEDVRGMLDPYAKTNAIITYISNQDYASKYWVSSQFATQSWVQSQGYLTSHQDLSSYATQSWVSTNYLPQSAVWTGTQSEWDQLTSEQKSTYKIALVTE